jgi:hypothetical protein
MSYHNTTQESGQQLIEFKDKAKTQDERVLILFKETPLSARTPSSIWQAYLEKYVGKNPPLTSIRRAISNLTRDEKLIKTPHKSYGIHGRTEYNWKFNNQRNE